MPLEDELRRLQKAATELNARVDAVNHLIAQVNTSLVKLDVGLEEWLDRPLVGEVDLGAGGTTGAQLGFARVKGHWCLALRTITVETRFFEGDESQPYTHLDIHGEPKPLSSASRIERCEAAGLLDGLVKQITQRLETLTVQVDQAAKGEVTP